MAAPPSCSKQWSKDMNTKIDDIDDAEGALNHFNEKQAGGDIYSNPVPNNFALLSGVMLRLSVEVGSTRMRLKDLLELEQGSIIELDRQANDLLDIFANGTLIAKGELANTGPRYGIKIVEIVSSEFRTLSVDRRA